MYKKEELIEMEKSFAKRHFKILVLILFYLVIETFRSLAVGTPVFWRAFIFCLVLLLEQGLRVVNFCKSPKLVFAVKYLQIFCASFFVMHSNYKYYEYIIYIILYFCFAMECSMFYDIADGVKLTIHNAVMLVPMLLSGLLYIFMNLSFENIVITTIIFISIAMTLRDVVGYFGEKYKTFEKVVFAKDRMIDKAMDNNKEIIEKQDKLFYVNEQLGLKRIELEAANHKINANNLEISIQNEILRFFASTLDMHIINQFFASKFVETMGIVCAGMLKIQSDQDSSVYTDYKRNNPFYDIDSNYKMFGNGDDELFAAMHEAFTTPEFVDKVLEQEFLICSNVKRSEYPFLTNAHVRSFIAKVMYIDGRKAGVYILCHEKPDFFDEHAKFFENMLFQLQVAMNNAFLYTQFENLAKKDGLTGLFNRRTLNKAMERYRHPDELIRKERIIAVMFDIDNFKSINDTYGHLFGDTAIIAVANIIGSIAEKYDGTSFRYGGEEFVVMFFNRNLEDIIPVVEEIHRTIRETAITLGDNSIHINTSAGVSAYPEICSDQAIIIDNADKAMYISKTTGKGKITIDGKSKDS